MALDSNVIDYSYVWKIENFDKMEQNFESPVFRVEVLDNTGWQLKLYPDASTDETGGFFSLFLYRTEAESHIKDVRIQFTMSIIATDVSMNVSKKITLKHFVPNNDFGFGNFISRETLFSNKHLYLPQNTLTIQCYMVRKTSNQDLTMFDGSRTRIEHDPNIKSLTLSDDLMRLYLDSTMCDVQIRVNDRTFDVHKTVICARSPVFLAMFQNETEQKKSGCIDITDVDPETVNSMLMFMYSDSIENMGKDQAEKLYSAAEKYGILPLKQKCSSVLKSFLSDENVCEIYTLGDSLQDADLKASAENYIFIYSSRIFKSSEWNNFMKSKPQLSSEIMHKLWVKHLDD